MEPIITSAVLGGLTKGVTSLFGDSEEEKRNKQRRRMLQAIRGQQEANRMRAETDKANSNREMSSEKADRRNVLSQKLAQYGYEPGGSIATNEKDLVLGNMREKENIRAGLNEANQILDREWGDVNAGIEEEPDPFSTFLGESISGASEGIKIGQALGFLDPNRGTMGAGTQTKAPTTPTKYDTPVTNPEITPNMGDNMNLSLFGEGGNKTMFGEGGVGFEMDPMLSNIPDYSSMMEGTGGDLAGYKNPFKKNNNALRIRR